MDVILSKSEKIFLTHGIEEGIREDGRAPDDYRTIDLELSVVPNANGSSRIKLGNSDVLAGVKCEIGEPDPGRPNEGKIIFNVDCSANAGTEWEGRGGDDLEIEISEFLSKAYSNKSCLDLQILGLIPGEQCWHLYIDVLILRNGGNILDAVSLAVKSALYDTEIPKVLIKMSEKGQSEVELTDNPSDYIIMSTENCPIFVSICKLGKGHVVDATAKESACTMAKIVSAVRKDGMITASQKKCSGSLQESSVLEMYEHCRKVGMELNKTLISKLSEAKNAPIVGFLA
ncbi:unnamed protein product [Dimorphilus gyrociliatus]|uniref:Ribosomal RNA-processing protein 42 n=1 Tax=Dimorphilus gyrociliatus TaxID=2664684 RepID=A0A7I8VRS2_9ANNE|nr:unnamed protein product [Dimorphilus gyrociliatus]